MSLRRFILLVVIFLTISVIVGFYHLYNTNRMHFRQASTSSIKGDILELGYSITKAVEKSGIYGAQNLLYKSLATHKEYKTLSLAYNKKILLSTNRKQIGQPFKGGMRVDAMSPKTLDREPIYFHEFSYFEADHRKVFLLVIELDKDHLAAAEEQALSLTNNMVIFFIIIMLVTLWLFYTGIIRPITRLAKNVEDEVFDSSGCYFREYSLLQNAFESRYQEVKSLNETLEKKVRARTEKLNKINDLFSEAQKLTHLGSWELDIADNKLHWSDEIYRIFGLKPQAFAATYDALINTIHKDDRDKVISAMNRTLETGDDYFIQHRIVLPDQSIKEVEERGTLEVGSSGNSARIIGTVHDITEAKKAQEQVVRLSKAIEDVDDIIAITDPNGILTFVNNSFVKHTGYTREESLGRTSSFLKSGEHDKVFYEELWKQITSGNTFRGRMVNRKKNGDSYYEEKTITPLKNKQHKITAFISTAKDITGQLKMQQELERLASTDQLTGIYNRHMFHALLNQEFERSNRYKTAFGVIMFDLDHFKDVNDNFGHDIGDHVLQRIADIVKNCIRASDIFSRWGGEEFLILCSGANLDQSISLAEKIRQYIEDEEFDGVGTITSSFGVTLYTPDDTVEALLRRVDDALYQSKNNGRNQVSFLSGA